jgi:ferrochelatase
MRYGNPSIASRLADLVRARLRAHPRRPALSAVLAPRPRDGGRRGVSRARSHALPAGAAHRAARTTATPPISRRWRRSTGAEIARLDFKPDVILPSFPRRAKAYVDKGRSLLHPVPRDHAAAARAARLDESKLLLTFQSRFGRAQWLEPATDQTVKRLGQDGREELAVITPGFSADCLETLEEIAVENAQIFKHNGGEHFAAIPCLNDSAPGMEVIRQLTERELQGWVIESAGCA